MPRILDIRLQKLFALTLILKVLSSGFGWYFQFTWSLGFVVPLILMVSYIAIGYRRENDDVPDEKFADSCYYLGFIFTITSIIFSLFDLPSIGTRIQDIAVRFGAAMISTVLGLSVRVYLVSFKRDAADILQEGEDALIDASQRFREQLVMAYENLRTFQSAVEDAAIKTVDGVNLQIEKLSTNHANKLQTFFADLTTRNQEAFTLALAEVKSASSRLADSVDGYSLGMRSNLTSIEAKVVVFTEAITERLRTTSFPDDYFAKQLAAPLSQLKDAAEDVSKSVRKASAEVNESSVVLAGALKKLRSKANSTEESLDTVLKLTEQQQSVLNAAQGQLTSLEKLSSTLSGFDALFTKTVAGIEANSLVTAELTKRISAVSAEGAEARKSLETTLATVSGGLAANALATDGLASRLEATAVASEQVVEKLNQNAAIVETVAVKLAENSAGTALVVGRLDGMAATELETSKTLKVLGQHASASIDKVDNAVSRLQEMVHQWNSLDSTLRTQSIELKEVAEKIKDIKVTFESPEFPNNSLSPDFPPIHLVPRPTADDAPMLAIPAAHVPSPQLGS